MKRLTDAVDILASAAENISNGGILRGFHFRLTTLRFRGILGLIKRYDDLGARSAEGRELPFRSVRAGRCPDGQVRRARQVRSVRRGAGALRVRPSAHAGRAPGAVPPLTRAPFAHTPGQVGRFACDRRKRMGDRRRSRVTKGGYTQCMIRFPWATGSFASAYWA